MGKQAGPEVFVYESRVRQFARSQGFQLGKKGVIALNGVLRDILIAAMDYCEERDRVRIGPRDIEFAWMGEDLARVIEE